MKKNHSKIVCIKLVHLPYLCLGQSELRAPVLWPACTWQHNTEWRMKNRPAVS